MQLAVIYFPEALSLISHAQQAIAGIVAFTAVGTGQKAVPMIAVVVEIAGHRERRATTARNHEHLDPVLIRFGHDAMLRAQSLLRSDVSSQLLPELHSGE